MNDNVSQARAVTDKHGAAAPTPEDLLSVKEAAMQLRVSEPTIWRWINQLLLPAYRVGQKRVFVKRSDLGPLITPAREKARDMAGLERGGVRPLTKREREQVLAAVQESRRHLSQMLEARGGRPYTSSGELLAEVREERSERF